MVQSIASIFVGMEAVLRYPPHIFLDSMGYAFTFPFAKLIGGCKVACYVHYPTISTDMLSQVVKRVTAYNNDPTVASSSLKTNLKIVYYRMFALIYGCMGYFANVVMVNSSWTRNHIANLWVLKPAQSNLFTVFPPVDVSHLIQIPLQPREKIVISVGQFRPEKDHALQLQAFALVVKQRKDIKLCLLGGVRDDADKQRVEHLKQMAKDLQIESNVEFLVGASFETLKEMLGKSTVGLHTMWNEHFGICIVEYMVCMIL